MKKLLLLCVMALTVMACPNDDDTGSDQDALIGTWKYFKYFENGVEQELEPCETDETTTVNADGTYSNEYFVEINGECDSDGVESGTWSNIGNGNYTFVFNNESDTEQITFESNTFYVEFFDNNGTPDDTSDDITERDVYIRQ